MWLFDLLKMKEYSKVYSDDRPAFVYEINNKNGYSSSLADIIIKNKEGYNMDREEFLNGFIARKEELLAEKLELENTNLDVLVEEEFDKVREDIRAKVLKEHEAKIEDKEFEIRAIQRLIDKELAKIEEEKSNEENIENLGE